jgi:type II secretory pathway pseudopilin PulG
MAIMVLFILLLLIATATRVALSASDTTRRDLQAKRALQAADTGLRMATYQQNALGLDLNMLLNLPQQCVIDTGQLGFQALVVGNWCQPVVEDMGNGVTWSYQVSPVITPPGFSNLGTLNAQAALQRTVVAVGTACRVATTACTPGTSGSVSRRLTATLQAGVPGVPTSYSSITSTLIPLLKTGTLTTKLQLYKQISFHECSPGAPPSSTVYHATGCGGP